MARRGLMRAAGACSQGTAARVGRLAATEFDSAAAGGYQCAFFSGSVPHGWQEAGPAHQGAGGRRRRRDVAELRGRRQREALLPGLRHRRAGRPDRLRGSGALALDGRPADRRAAGRAPLGADRRHAPAAAGLRADPAGSSPGRPHGRAAHRDLRPRPLRPGHRAQHRGGEPAQGQAPAGPGGHHRGVAAPDPLPRRGAVGRPGAGVRRQLPLHVPGPPPRRTGALGVRHAAGAPRRPRPGRLHLRRPGHGQHPGRDALGDHGRPGQSERAAARRGQSQGHRDARGDRRAGAGGGLHRRDAGQAATRSWVSGTGSTRPRTRAAGTCAASPRNCPGAKGGSICSKSPTASRAWSSSARGSTPTSTSTRRRCRRPWGSPRSTSPACSPCRAPRAGWPT